MELKKLPRKKWKSGRSCGDIDEEGHLIPAEYESKDIDIEKGILKITGVKIYHFSRYGWAK